MTGRAGPSAGPAGRKVGRGRNRLPSSMGVARDLVASVPGHSATDDPPWGSIAWREARARLGTGGPPSAAPEPAVGDVAGGGAAGYEHLTFTLAAGELSAGSRSLARLAISSLARKGFWLRVECAGCGHASTADARRLAEGSPEASVQEVAARMRCTTTRCRLRGHVRVWAVPGGRG